MKKTLLLVILLFSWATVPAQIWAGLDQVICGSDSVTLGAQVDYVAPTLVYANGANLTDDQYSDVIALGFNFTFFGNTYDKLVFSSNNYITFDTTVATGYSNWDITGPAPTAGNTPTNAILGPWQDVNPSPFPPPPVYAVMYGIYGPPGQRVFVAGFCETPMFSCTGLLFSSQIKLFEADSLLFNPVVEDDRCNNGVGRVIPNIAGGVLPYQILWSNGSVSDTLSNVTAGVYSLICTDALGCVHTDTFTVGNMDFAVVIDSILGLPEACGRADGFIEVAASGGTSPYLYEWSDGSTGSLISGLMTGFYDLTVSDLNGCTAYGQYFVPYHEAPIPGIVGPDSVDTADSYATFYDTTDAIASWTWQFGDGSSGIDSVVTHVYQQDEEYLVSLTVTDSMGCEGITTKTLFVVEEFFYYVPNAFTPNQDGTNELFFPVILGADPTTYLFQIYSRNGQMIWESSDLSTGWNGTVDNAGTEAKQDVFTWRLYFRTFSGREIVEKGTITLIR